MFYQILHGNKKFILIYILFSFNGKESVFVSMSLKIKIYIRLSLTIKVARSDDHEYKLVKDLLKDYNLLARPSLSHLHPTNVSFDMSLSQLIDVVNNYDLQTTSSSDKFNFFCSVYLKKDEKNQVITTNVWVTMVKIKTIVVHQILI